MKMYKREEEVDGMVVDPLKAIHQVTGVTAKELTHYFFNPGTHLDLILCNIYCLKLLFKTTYKTRVYTSDVDPD